MSFTLHGLPVSSGIAIGRAHLLSHATLAVRHYQIPPRHVDAEVARFEAAVKAVLAELATIKDSAGTSAPAELAAFVELHAMLLADPDLSETPKQTIRERRCNAEWALVQQMEVLVAQFEEIEDVYLRERKADIVQVVERVVKELLGHPGKTPPKVGKEENLIVVAYDLSPADVILFKRHQFGAFITDMGGATSHTAILARSMGIPAIVGLHHARQIVRDNELLIVDGTRGVVIVNPDKRVLEEYELKRSEIELERSKLKRIKSARAATLDGTKVALHANIELPQDVGPALDVGAGGIGLFRSEFLFLNRGDVPTEDEQFEAYRTVVEAMDGKPVTIRTLDLGADKALSSMDRTQTNPALGLRAIRYCLAEPQMFLIQLRAILRASAYGKVKLLIPMVSHLHEIEQTLNLIDLVKQMLRLERTPFDEDIPVGGMVEVPAAALALSMFVRRLQFLSIGTNDLIQYTLAIDRTDEAVSHLYDPLHPAILFLIGHTIATGEKAGLQVSVCGEMAGDARLTRLLLGLGLRNFSMHPSQLLEVKQQVLRSDIPDLTAQVKKLVRLDDPQRIRELLEKLNA